MELDKGLKLGEQHWGYIEALLRIHGESEEIIQKIKFHYIFSFMHGYKHGRQDEE